MFRHIKNIHFIGIGGIGMSGIAELLLNHGYKISGSDIMKSTITERLEKLGAKITYEHKKENVKNADLVVYSSAIKPDNIEFKEAKKRNIPCIPRIEILGEIMRMKEGIAVCGTHGKTTTTSMIGKILEVANLSPTLVIGGQLKTSGMNVKLGNGKFMVCEVDESDKLLLNLTPVIIVITSIDEDHLDVYKDIKEIRKTFLQFTEKVPFYGCNILCIEDKNIKKIIPKIKKRYITYGFDTKSDVRITKYKLGERSHFCVKSNGQELGEFTLSLPGLHNILNAAGAIATATEIGISLQFIKEGIAEVKGATRRFELKGTKRGIKIFDDYAHHPTEIEATIKTAKQLFSGRILVIFQPHLYSRTMKLANKFAYSFREVDKVILVPIYPAREKPIEGVTSELIAKEAKKLNLKNISYIEEENKVIQEVINYAKKGDVIFTIGAGDVYKLADKLLQNL